MKKIISVLISVLLISAFVLSIVSCGKKDSDDELNTTVPETQELDEKEPSTNETPTKPSSVEDKNEKPEDSSISTSESADSNFMQDSLFIGDSRTVGISEYSNLSSDFFANVGMSVYNIHSKPVSVPSVGKLTFEQLLKSKKYGKIYVMLGLNEIGYNMEQTINKYKSLIDEIKAYQPNAKIFIEANLHVTKRKSDSDKYANNAAINRFNNGIKALADNRSIFYLDANTLFDDSTGSLARDKTSDEVHPYAKYYKDWGKWIETESFKLLKSN